MNDPALPETAPRQTPVSGDEPIQGPIREGLMLAGGALMGTLLLWLVSETLILPAAFFATALLLGALGWGWLRQQSVREEISFAIPDWTVTLAALERPDQALAITDRAGRLVCASSLYRDCFGIDQPPAQLALDPASVEAIGAAMRNCWRDGRAGAAGIASQSSAQSGVQSGAAQSADARQWRLDLLRAGRGEDHLIWRFIPVTSSNPLGDVVALVDGKLGRALSAAGMQLALVNPDGSIETANGAFAMRATGEPANPVAGRNFVSFLRSDEGNRVYYTREGRKGMPLRLIHLPVSDPDLPGDPDPATTPSLILLMDQLTGSGGMAGSVDAAHIEALLATLPLGLAMTDRDGRFLFANDSFARAGGFDAATLPPYPSDLVIREDKAALSDAVRRYGLGSNLSGDVAVRMRHAPDEPISMSLAGVRGMGDGAVLLSLKDSSEETRLKREIAQATKMQAVGQLAGGVAHDFNNVLTAIIGYCDLMLLRHSPGDSDYDDIVQIKANSNRAASLTRQLLAFSRQQTLRPEVLQLPDVVAEVTTLLKRLLGEKITLTVHHDRNLGPVRADPVQLEQVLMNLAVNARDAIHGKGDGAGTLKVSTRRITTQQVRAMKSEILPAAEYSALVVEDSGGGIPPELIGKIFEPFFTTKELGKGTGLGLSTVYGIVKQSGGFVFAQSDQPVNGKGGGTCFTIYLPVHVAGDEAQTGDAPASTGNAAAAPPAPSVAAQSRPATPSWGKGGHILLVEDEDTVRAVAERALLRHGYQVVCASDGEEGLEIARNHPADAPPFDLVVSDVVMPIMDGPTMARAIRAILPDLPVLFMSGYAEEQLRKSIDIGNMHFLPKPFSVQQIGDAVGRVLGRGD